MSIRSEFQARIDEFITDLEEFASGSYLQEGETEFWEEPFDISVLPELKAIIESILDALDVLPDDPDSQQLYQVLKVGVDKLQVLNERNEHAVLEPEEWAELKDILHDASAATGTDDEALNGLDELIDY